MKHIRSAASAALLALAFAARPALAQRDMYGMGGASASDTRRQFTAEARTEVGALMAEYESAWGSHDLRALMRLYGETATLYPSGGGMLTGRDAVRGFFGKLLPEVQPLRTSIVEFKAAGDLAFATLQVRYTKKDAAGERTITGTDVMVLRKDWAGDWSIVTHFLRQDDAAMAAGGRSAADSAGSQ